MSMQEKYPFLKELGIKEINSGSCAGPDNWGPTEGRDMLELRIRPRSS